MAGRPALYRSFKQLFLERGWEQARWEVIEASDEPARSARQKTKTAALQIDKCRGHRS